MNKAIIVLLTLSLLYSCKEPPVSAVKETPAPKEENFVPNIAYTISGSIPHDTTSFTEGLLFHDQQLFESTGSPAEYHQTKSLLGIVDVKTGKIDKKVELDRNIYFGEGIVFFKNKIYQLTYKNQIGFIYDAKTYKKTGQFEYKNKEGWGLTTDGTAIIMSDGTSTLTYLDPENFKVLKTLKVSNNGSDEEYLNELEYINGFIYANIWTKNYIVKIAPESGKIVGILDLSNIYYTAKNGYPNSLETNGIAFNPRTNKIYITGKLWPAIYILDFPH
jgi:glutaminyl-peptide cyclotransferase